MSSDLIGKLETDVEIKASATKFHDIFMKRPHHISNVSSEKIQGCELHEGEWGTVGSVIYWNYHHGKASIYIYSDLCLYLLLLWFKKIHATLSR